MGLNLEVMKGRDGFVSFVHVKTVSTVLVRSISKIIILEDVHHWFMALLCMRRSLIVGSIT